MRKVRRGRELGLWSNVFDGTDGDSVQPGDRMIKPYSYNSLFRPGPNSSLNACVGANGGPYDFGSYAEGFFEAGFQIVDAIKRGEWTTDILIYPAVFDFRHAGNQVVEKLPDGGQMLFDRRLGHLDSELFNVGGHGRWPDASNAKVRCSHQSKNCRTAKA